MKFLCLGLCLFLCLSAESSAQTIKTVSGVTWANVKTVAGVTNANTKTVSGVPAPSGASFAGLLDTVTNAGFFYSLRRVNSAYTGNLIRVRRSSDLTESDIGAVGDTLDTATLLTFCGSGTGYVVYWYDQSGNGRDAIGMNQASGETNLPIIVTSGALEKLNGRVAIALTHPRAFVWTDTGTNIGDLITAVGGSGSSKFATGHIVASIGSGPTQPRLFTMNDPGGNEFWWIYEDGGSGRIEFNGTASAVGAALTRDAQTIWCGRVNGGTFEIWENGSSIGSGTNNSIQTSTTTQVSFAFGGGSFSSRNIEGKYQEIGSWKTSENPTTLYNSANAYW